MFQTLKVFKTFRVLALTPLYCALFTGSGESDADRGTGGVGPGLTHYGKGPTDQAIGRAFSFGDTPTAVFEPVFGAGPVGPGKLQYIKFIGSEQAGRGPIEEQGFFVNHLIGGWAE